jgi:hypothetical protein
MWSEVERFLRSRASSRVRGLAAAHLPGSSFEVDVGAQKRRGFRKPRSCPRVLSRLLLGVAPSVRPEPAQVCARNR